MLVAHPDLDSAVDELYSVPREEFTAVRTELAKAAKAAGDRDTAAEIEKLAKPTTAAWLANQLARTERAEVGELVELGDALRDAHERLDGAELKTLTLRRTELIGELIRQAELMHGRALSESVHRELEEVCAAAVADAAVGQALLAGRLTSARGVAGPPVWPSPTAGSGRGKAAKRPASEAQAKPKPAARADAGERRRRQLEQAERALREARDAVKDAEAARADEERALADAEAEADEAAAEVRRLERLLEAAEATERDARSRIAMARRAVKAAERRAAQAWRQVQQAERKLAEP